MNSPDITAYQSLGQNPREIPAGEWVRVYLSGTGNVETFACHSLKLTYTIISN